MWEEGLQFSTAQGRPSERRQRTGGGRLAVTLQLGPTHSPMCGGITATYFRPDCCSISCIRIWSSVTSCSLGGTLDGSHRRKAGGT